MVQYTDILDKKMAYNPKQKIETPAAAEDKKITLSDKRQEEGLKTAEGLTEKPTTKDLADETANGLIQKSYLQNIESLKAHTEPDRTKLKKASIENVRYQSRLLVEPAKEKETPIEQIKNLKQETARRIKAYSSKIEGEWITLNYEQIGSDTKGRSHEYYVGLGDILVDPDITEIEVVKNGKTFKCIRSTGSSGRNCFKYAEGNRKGRYCSTFTGDQYRILSKTEVDLNNETEVKNYIKKTDQETQNKSTYKENEESREYTPTIDENNSIASQINRKLTAEQAKMVNIIEEEFTAALSSEGLSPIAIKKIVAAAVVNAWHESTLNPNAVGDSGASVGLFQLHIRGAGSGLTTETRKDPRTNARIILKREVLGSFGEKLIRAAKNPNSTVAQLTAIFCERIERPRNKEIQGQRRARTAMQFFPGEIKNSTPRTVAATQAKETATTKPQEKFHPEQIALLGDSYANGQWNAGLRSVIPKENYFAQASTKTTDYLGLLAPNTFKTGLLEGSEKRQKLISAIKNSKLIYLKLGGNEYTFGVERFKRNMRTLIDYIKRINPNAQIAIPEIGPTKSTKIISPKRIAQKNEINKWIRSGESGLFRPLVWYNTVADKDNPEYYETKYNRRNPTDGHLNIEGFQKLNKAFLDNFVA